MNKKGSIFNQVVIHIILVGIIFAIFLLAVSDRVNSRGVKQQVLEKQVALLIDSAEPGMSFGVSKVNVNGLVSDVEIKDGRVFVDVDGLNSFKGYPYFSGYRVSVEDVGDKFVIGVR